MADVRETGHSSGWLPAVVSTHGSIPMAFERTDLRELLGSSLAPLVAQARRLSIDVRVDTLGQLPAVEVDREKIAWAVATVVGNAMRYVTGSSIEGRRCILVHLHADDVAHEVAISVHDDGPGLPPEKLPHLFVRRPGALHVEGLALSLVRDVVGAHDGRIEVESCTDSDVHGTSITLRLPTSRERQGQVLSD